jgi:F5/8 type C domain/Alpha-L-fucosidase/NPCBM-associated, NEW3 domain of alpha-galactosidase/Carbohydrate binding module (family 35)
MPGRRAPQVVTALLVTLGLVLVIAVPARAELFHPRQEWLRNSTTGLFLHWGMFTTPIHTDCAEWEQAVTDGGWTADYWVQEAQKLHASYIVLATFHSRLGYARPWPSKIPGSCATKRDFLGELIDAAKARGLRVILYMTDDPQWHDERGVESLDSEAYSAYKGRPVDLTTRDGFGEYSYDLFFEVMRDYPDLSGFWIDNDNAYWERNHLYEQIRELRPSWTLSNNNEDTPVMDMVSHEQKTGMTPPYDYPQAVWTPLPRLTEGEWKLPEGGTWWYDGRDREVDYPLNIGRVIANAGSTIKSLINETAQVNGRFPPKQQAFNDLMAGYLDEIWGSIRGTEGGGYLYGGLKPGFWNDGAHGVTTIDKSNPDRHYIHVITPPSGGMLRVRDNGYKVTEVTDFRTGERLRFNQSGGYLTIMGVSRWDLYDTVFRVETDGRQFIYPQDSLAATASASRSGFPASNLVDGSYLTWWDNGGTLPADITLDLGERKPSRYLAINQREWSPTYNRETFGRQEDSARIKDYRLYASDDGVHWGDPIKAGTMPSARAVQFIDFGETKARYLRLEILSNWSVPTLLTYYRQIRIDELYVGHRYPFRAANPLPYEAEAHRNVLGGTAREVRCWACSGAAQVTGLGGGSSNSVTVTGVELEEGGDYRLDLHYTADGDGTFGVSVNGGDAVRVPVSGQSSDVPESTPMAVHLEAGANSIRFYAADGSSLGLDRISIGPLPPPSYVPKTTVNVEPAEAWVGRGRQSFEVSGEFRLDDADPVDDVTFAPVVPEGWTVEGEPATAARMQPGQTLAGSWTITTPEDDYGVVDIPVRASFEMFGRSYSAQETVRVQMLPPGWVFIGEAEFATLNGSTGVGGCGQCSGGEKVRFIGNSPNNYVTFENVKVDQAGRYELSIDYTVNGTRSFWVSVNGGPGTEVQLTGSSWDVPATATTTVTLAAGTNTIKVYNDTANAPDLDRIRVADPGM